MHELTEQQLLGQRLLDLLLDQAAHRARAVQLVVALLGQPRLGRVVQADMNRPVRQLELQLEDELVHHAGHDLGREIAEGHDRIQAVAELGREHLLHGLLVLALAGQRAEA